MTNATAKIWFDNFPRNTLSIRFLPFLSRLSHFWAGLSLQPIRERISQQALQDFLPTSLPHNFQLNSIKSSLKDRGILMEFSYDPSVPNAREQILSQIRNRLGTETDELMSLADRSFPSFTAQVRAFLVKGEPFIEDLVSKPSSKRLKIEFHGVDPTFDMLYGNLRRYGRLLDLTFYPNKDGLRYATALFVSSRSASSARMCLSGTKVGDTRLFIQYDPILRTNVVRKWIMDHQRISIPIIATALVAVSYSIFDPIRILFITNNITKSYSLESFVPRKLRTLLNMIPSLRSDFDLKKKSEVEQVDDFSVRREIRERIETILQEKPSRCVLVIGPRGYGKSQLLKTAVNKQRYHLSIDCNRIASGGSETGFVSRLAEQIGYFPTFSLSWLTKAADAAITASTGAKAGLSTSTETELKNILQLTTISLMDIVDSQKRQISKTLVEGSSTETSHIDYPTILITSFMDMGHHHFSSDNNSLQESLYEILAEWGSYLSEQGIAHVIFVSSESGSGADGRSERLNKLFGKVSNHPYESLIFSDASRDDALKLIIRRLATLPNVQQNPAYIDVVLENLGGKLADLETFLDKIKIGYSIEFALNDMILRALSELRKFGLGEGQSAVEMEWTPAQFWFLLKEFCKYDQLNYQYVKESDLFGDEKSIRALERADLINISYANGIPKAIRPSRPLYLAAMKRLQDDASYAASLNLKLLKTLIDKETEKARVIEKELMDITHILDSKAIDEQTARGEKSWLWSSNSSQTIKDGLVARFQFLNAELKKSQTKIQKYQQEQAQQKSIISN